MKTEVANNYKRKIASRYLPVGPDQITSKILESEQYFISQKYDGHLYFLSFDGKKAVLKNHGGSEITDLSFLLDFSKKINSNDKIVFAGELYVLSKDQRTRAFDVTAALKSNKESLKFAVFDIVEINGNQPQFNVNQVFDELNKILPKDLEGIHIVDGQWVDSRKEIEVYFNELVTKNNAEGIVVKAIDGPVYKIKPYITIDAVILGFSEGEDARKGMVRELLLGLMTGENEFRILTQLGNGLSEKDRKTWFEVLNPEIVNSEYIEVSGANLAFNMVKPCRVIELSCTDLISQNTKGQIQKMSLNYSRENGYAASGKSSMVSVFSPVFVKNREDKKVNLEDAGMTQVTRLIELESKPSIKLDDDKVKSKVIKREVYVKESKGNKMVRKFVAWKTNKEHTQEYPAFVLYMTDFSPSRSEKLKTKLRVSNDEKNILKIMKSEIEENIKKGWNKI